MRIIILSALILSLWGCKPVIYNLTPTEKRVITGLERFVKWHAGKYRGKKAAIVTNHSGVNFHLYHNIRLLRKKGVFIKMVFAPEHGLYGYHNDIIKRLYRYDRDFNTVIYNLYQIDHKTLQFLLAKNDIVIFDIQDMGMRCYTYVSNLKAVMDALYGMPPKLIVLDRPNPIGFLKTDGANLEERFRSKFISAFPAPFIYNMTIGEAALYYKGEYCHGVNLEVIKMKRYSRNMTFLETGLPWVPPSPNLPSYESSILYTAVVLLEGINISIGRGTTKPFEYIGAPWINAEELCRGFRKLGLKNFKFRPVYFKPTFSKHMGRSCGGVQIFYIGGRFSPTEVSYKITRYVLKHYRQAKWEKYRWWFDIDTLAGTNKFRHAVNAGKTYEQFYKTIKKNQKIFKKRRKKYTLY